MRRAARCGRWSGGRDYRRSVFNRATMARRQPGSAFKPFVWAAALEAGLSPDDTVLDAPIRIGGWSPANFERRYLGEITLEEALAQSVNTASVRLLMQAGGPRAVAGLARRLGITDPLPANASIALGTGRGGAFAADRRLRHVLQWRRAGHAVRHSFRPAKGGGPRRRAAGAGAGVRSGSRGDDGANAGRRRQPGQRPGGRRSPGRTVAGKTGTTQDYRDAWFVGWTNGMVIGVWLGNDDNRPPRG